MRRHPIQDRLEYRIKHDIFLYPSPPRPVQMRRGRQPLLAPLPAPRPALTIHLLQRLERHLERLARRLLGQHNVRRRRGQRERAVALAPAALRHLGVEDGVFDRQREARVAFVGGLAGGRVLLLQLGAAGLLGCRVLVGGEE